jgi:hypothetical protein
MFGNAQWVEWFVNHATAALVFFTCGDNLKDTGCQVLKNHAQPIE